MLSGSAAITVFAPNNAAVLNISRNELDYLYNIRNNKTLYSSLAFGATAAALPTSSFANGQVLATLEGSFTHTVHVYGPEIQIDAATITSADRKADNGFVNKVRALLQAVLCRVWAPLWLPLRWHTVSHAIAESIAALSLFARPRSSDSLHCPSTPSAPSAPLSRPLFLLRLAAAGGRLPAVARLCPAPAGHHDHAARQLHPVLTHHHAAGAWRSWLAALAVLALLAVHATV